MTKRVVTKGGGNNLYHISIYEGTYSVSQVIVKLISNDYKTIGKASSLENALSLIKAHSGNQIKEIRDL